MAGVSQARHKQKWFVTILSSHLHVSWLTHVSTENDDEPTVVLISGSASRNHNAAQVLANSH